MLSFNHEELYFYSTVTQVLPGELFCIKLHQRYIIFVGFMLTCLFRLRWFCIGLVKLQSGLFLTNFHMSWFYSFRIFLKRLFKSTTTQGRSWLQRWYCFSYHAEALQTTEQRAYPRSLSMFPLSCAHVCARTGRETSAHRKTCSVHISYA